MERLLEVLEPDNPSEAELERAQAGLEELSRQHADESSLDSKVVKATALVALGQVLTARKRMEEARARFEEVVRRFGGNFAWSMQSVVAESLVRLGALLHETGRTEEARVALGEDLRRASLLDTEIHPLPVDEEWRKIIREVPVS